MTRKALRRRLWRAMVASAALGASTRPAVAHDRLPALATRVPGGHEFFRPAALASAAADGAPDPATLRRFDIAPGPLGAVIAAFERVAGVRVTLPVPEARAIDSPGVSGFFTVEQALAAMLAGTSLSARLVAPDAAVIEFRAASSSVDVTAPAAAVSSPKYAAPLRDIPQTIDVIPSAVLAGQGVTTLRDALRNVSGITYQAGEGGTPAGDQMTIRGFSARTDIFVDGVRDIGGYARDTFDLEQVEVAKGPASAISGRGSTGGSINLVTKAPRRTPASVATAEAGSAGVKRSTLDVNRPFGAGGASAIRVNAMWTDGGVPGRDVVSNRSWGLAPSLAFGLAAPTRLTVGYEHLQQHNLPDYGLPYVPAGNVPLSAWAGGAPPVAASNYYGLRQRDYETVHNDLATLTVGHDVGPRLSLRTLTRFGRTGRDSVITAPRFVGDASTDIRRTDMKSRDQSDAIVANQTSAVAHVGTGRLAHTISTGLELSREAETSFARAEYGPDTPVSPETDLFAPDPDAPYTGFVRRTGASTDSVAESIGAYLFDTVSLGARWQVTGGARWDRFAVRYRSVDPGGLQTPLARTDAVVSWRGGIVYQPRPTGSVYLGYATSFNPSAEGLSLSAATVAVGPERTRSAEAGTKWGLAGERLSLHAAVFRTEKLNARTPGVNAGDPPTVLQGRQVVDGVELGLSGRVGRRWSGLASYTFLHSAIAASNTPAEIDLALALTPSSTFNAWTTCDLWRGVTVGGGVQFMDAVFRNARTTVRVPSYWLVNAMAAWAVNDHLTLRLNADNLPDAHYIDRTSGGHFIPGPARSLRLGTTVRF